MKYYIYCFSLLVVLFVSGFTVTGAEFNLKNGVIYVSENGNAGSVKINKFAAGELRKHLELISGAKIKIEPVKTLPANPGKDKLNFFVGFKIPGSKTDGDKLSCHYAIRGHNIYFWGYNRSNNDVLNYSTLRGTANAVYLFLENVFGVKWIYPGDKGIVYKKRSSIILPDKLDFSGKQKFNMTMARTYTWKAKRVKAFNKFVPAELRASDREIKEKDHEQKLWGARNRLGRWRKISYGHAFTNWWDKYGKTHPEYFGLNPYGKRGLSEKYKTRVKICVTNPDVVKQIIADWKKSGTQEYLNICENDGTMGYCRCPKCMALDTRTKDETFYDHLTDRYVYFWNKVTEQARKVRPDVKLVVYVYSYYRLPPRREKIEYPENMLIGIVPKFMDDNQKLFSEWRKAGAKHVFLRPNDLAHGPVIYRGLDKYFYDKFQASKVFKLWGADYDGYCGNRAIDFDYFMTAKMINDPDKKFEEIEDEYCSAYGNAAPAVKKFLALQRQDGKTMIKKIKGIIEKDKVQFLDSSFLGVVIARNAAKLIKNNFAEADKILKSAGSLKLSESEREKLEELIVQNQHARLTYEFFVEGNKKKAGKKNDLNNAAKRLLDFRIKNKNAVRMCWPVQYGRGVSGEKEYWAEVSWYRKNILKKHKEGNKDTVFFDSFDLPAMDGWRQRDNFVEITKEKASFDKYSIKLKSTDKKRIGISKHGVKVEPGKKYKVSFDSFLEGDVEYARLRCVASGKTLFNILNRNKGNLWTCKSKKFTVPEKVDKLTFYVYTGPSKQNASVFVDKISLKKLN